MEETLDEWLEVIDLNSLKGIGVAFVSLEGTILRCNEAFANLMDKSAHLMKNQNVWRMTSDEDRQETSVTLQRLRNGDIKEHEAVKRYVTAAGETKWCHLFVQSIWENGKPSYLRSWIHHLPHHSDAEISRRALQYLVELGFADPARVGTVNYMMGDHNQTVSADNHGRANANGSTNHVTRTGLNATTLILLFVVAILGVLLAVAMTQGSGLSLQHGSTAIEVTPTTPEPTP